MTPRNPAVWSMLLVAAVACDESGTLDPTGNPPAHTSDDAAPDSPSLPDSDRPLADDPTDTAPSDTDATAPTDDPVAMDSDPAADTDETDIGGGPTDAPIDSDIPADTSTPLDTDTPPDTGWSWGGPAQACDAPIPNTAQVIQSNTILTDDHAIAWVCRNKTLSMTGNQGVVFVETGGQVTLSGDGHIVYAANRADVVIVSGHHDIREHQRADVLVLSTGTADQQVCVDLTFDISAAPPGGC